MRQMITINAINHPTGASSHVNPLVLGSYQNEQETHLPFSAFVQSVI